MRNFLIPNQSRSQILKKKAIPHEILIIFKEVMSVAIRYKVFEPSRV